MVRNSLWYRKKMGPNAPEDSSKDNNLHDNIRLAKEPSIIRTYN